MNEERVVFTRKTSGLVKGLSWWDVFLLVISAPAGSGILYYSVSTAADYPGGSVPLSFLIGMVLILPVVFIAAVTAGMIPRSGSLYVLISRVISPAVGFLAASLFFVGYTLSIGVVAFVVTQVAGGILVNTANAADWVWAQTLGEALQEPLWSTVGGCLLVILTWLLVLGGIKVFRNVMRVLFVVTVVAAVVTVVYLLLTPSLGGAPALFNQVWGSGSYEQVLQVAADNDWSPPDFSLDATLGLLLVVLFSFGGLELISYASGEVSHAQRSPLKGYIGGWIALGLIYVVISVAVVSAFGPFLGAYDFLVQNHPEALAGVVPAVSPSVPFYIASVMPSPWLGVVVSLALSLWLITTMIPYFFSPSRLVFALAMDRAIPGSLAKVDPRTGAPTNASHLTLVFAIAGVLLNLLNVGVVLGTILFCALFVYWLYGLSGLLLPYRRPDLYKASPVQSQFAGLPTVSWVGLAAFGVGWYVIFVAVGQLSTGMTIFLAILMTVALCIYGFGLHKNQREGVDVEQIYNQIPPD